MNENLRGPYQGHNLIGEITEAIQQHLIEGWDLDRPPPRIEEDLSFEPKDREEVIYVYMYRVSQNPTLLNSKRWRPARVVVGDPESVDAEHFLQRAPLYLDVHYLVATHSKFRSDAERLAGWVLLRLHEATQLVYRPRRYLLPDGRQVDSRGETWSADASGEDVVMEKVSIALVDDLTLGDAVNFFSIHDAPYRPYFTYRARCAMEGSLAVAKPTIIRSNPAVEVGRGEERRSSGRVGSGSARRNSERTSAKMRTPFGPGGYDHGPIPDVNEED